MNDLIPVTQNAAISINQSDTTFQALVEATLATVASSSARVYQQTFTLWQQWCYTCEIDPLNLIATNVREFLMSQRVGQRTRQRQLSALRKLARVLALDYTHPAWRSAYESLQLLRVPTEGITKTERNIQALSPSQVARILEVWQGNKLIEKRNRALIGILFLTGMRRSEAAALRWSDLDLTEGVIAIRHGKGDKARTVAIAGDIALEALHAWKTALGEGRDYIFCAIGKGNRLGADVAMTDHSVYEVVKQTEKMSGIVFTPHDVRRTFITEALVTGAPLADVQAQAGHKQESTTLRYTKPVDARHRRGRLRLRYGS